MDHLRLIHTFYVNIINMVKKLKKLIDVVNVGKIVTGDVCQLLRRVSAMKWLDL